MSESVILEEEIDEDYEPTAEEILEYATWLGMDAQMDKDFFYIAKEGLKAPLPEPWKPCKTKEGEIYYFNFDSGESVWEHPCDEYYRKMFEEAKTAKANRGIVTKKARKKNTTKSAKKKRDNDPIDIMENFQIPKAQKKSLGAYDSSSGVFKKEEDAILKAEKEKKKRREREAVENKHKQILANMEAEFEQRKQKLKVKAEEELETLERRHNSDKSNIEYDIKAELQSEADRKRSEVRKESQKREEKEQQQEQDLFDKKIAEIQEDHETKLKREKARISENLEAERKSILGKEEKLIMADIDNLKREVEYQKEKVTREEADLLEIETRYRDKIQRLEQDFKTEVESERVRMSATGGKATNDDELLRKEAEIEAIESSLNLDRGDTDLRIKEKQLELQMDFDQKLVQMKKDLEAQDSEALKSKTKDVEIQLKSEFEAACTVLDSQYVHKRDDINNAHAKELDALKSRSDKTQADEVSRISRDIQVQIDAEKHRMEIESRKRLEEKRGKSPGVAYQERLMEIQKELNKVQDQIIATEQMIEDENTRTERCAEELKNLDERMVTLESEPSQKYLIEDLKKQIEEKDKELDITGSPRADMAKLGKLEQDISDIKESIGAKINMSPSKQNLDKDSVSRWKKIIQSEKLTIKDQQRLLEHDRQLWKQDANEIVSRPYSNPSKKAELTSVKKVLDAQTRQLNGRIRELRFVEKWVRSKEGAPSEVPDFDFEEDILMAKRNDEFDAIDEDVLYAWKSGREVDSSFEISGMNTPNAPDGYAPFFKKARQPRVQSARRRRAEWELAPQFTRNLYRY